MFDRRFRRFNLLLLGLAVSFGFFAVPVTEASGCGTHRVAYGETLFRISLRYNVSMAELARVNGIYNYNRIYAGQVLTIPCGSSYRPPTNYRPPQQPYYLPQRPYYPPWQPYYPPQQPYYPPQQPYYPPYQPSVGYLDCSGFRATSPVEGFPNGRVTFYWDPPRSSHLIARYQVRIFNEQGAAVGAFETLNIGTNLSIDVSQGAIGPGIRFSYYVVGVTADSRLCQTQTVSLQREWPQ